ncbi:hypothetical protein [Microcoleus sp. herbarium2]|uniref:hypothetical protein n=1 Tax=Microcoleus sp. herbarium2 TaxID=3055433 RepID=UPI002FD46A04
MIDTESAIVLQDRRSPPSNYLNEAIRKLPNIMSGRSPIINFPPSLPLTALSGAMRYSSSND